jgi:hypothetical protein
VTSPQTIKCHTFLSVPHSPLEIDERSKKSYEMNLVGVAKLLIWIRWWRINDGSCFGGALFEGVKSGKTSTEVE